MIKVVAYRFSALGDVAMTAPVFREILEQNPNLEITIVSRDSFRDIFEGIPHLNFKGVNLKEYKGLMGMRKLALEIHHEIKPDFIADLHDVIRSKMLNKIFKIKGYKVFKINKGKEEKKLLTDVWNIEKHPIKRTTERYADVFREMGFPVTLSDKLRPTSEAKHGIGIAPFAQHKGKVMTIEKTYELIKIIAKKEKVYLFGGGKEETEILSQWEKEIPNTHSLAGKLKLKEELQQIGELKLMISMDSANMHFASLMGTRCISIWGQTHPYAGFLGYGQRLEDAIHIQDLTCRPCSVFGDKECYRGDWACLHEINIQKILSKVYPQEV